MRIVAAITAMLAPLFASGVATAATTEPIVVNSDGPAQIWQGSVTRTGPATDKNAVCETATAKHNVVVVRLPERVRERRGATLEFAIRWNGEISFNDNLCLRIVHKGHVTELDALVASAQSVQIPLNDDGNGKYDVSVAYNRQSDNGTIPYDILTQVQYPSDKGGYLLPDLVSRPQRNITFDHPDFDLFEPAPPPGHSCFDSEKAPDGSPAKLCLRFDQVLANQGDGPLDIRFSRQTGVTQNEPAQQWIYKANLDPRHALKVSAGTVEWHAVHGHYHFENFAVSSLWAIDAHGKQLGTTAVATGRKVSFCIADTDYDRWGGKPVGAMFYIAPNCLDPYETTGGREYFKQGMSVGWGDVYNWFLPDQFIEASNVPDGLYALRTTVDPSNNEGGHDLREANYANNCNEAWVRLTGMNTGTPHAQLITPGQTRYCRAA